MTYYATAFLLVAIAAGLFGISGVTEGAALVGSALFLVFVALAGICLLFSYANKAKIKELNQGTASGSGGPVSRPAVWRRASRMPA